MPIMKIREMERDIERYLVKRVKGCGGEALKFTSPGRANVPDRQILKTSRGEGYYLPGAGIAVFVECKAPGEKCTSGQLREQQRLLDMGFSVYVVDTRQGVDAFIKAEFRK